MEGQPLLWVPCLRGQLLSLNGDWAMLWIVDLGLLGFIPKAKLYPLSQELAELPWLISICLLRGKHQSGILLFSELSVFSSIEQMNHDRRAQKYESLNQENEEY